MTTNAEWTDLVTVWQQSAHQDDGTEAGAIRRRVAAQSRRMSLALFAEYAVGALITCVVAWKLATDKGLDTFVWGFAVLWFTGMALQFTSTNRQGLWIPATESVVAYLDLALERLQRRQKSLRFAWMLLGWLALVIVALAGWTAVTRSRIAAECADLARIRAELLADEQRPGSPPALLRLSRGTGIG